MDLLDGSLITFLRMMPSACLLDASIAVWVLRSWALTSQFYLISQKRDEAERYFLIALSFRFLLVCFSTLNPVCSGIISFVSFSQFICEMDATIRIAASNDKRKACLISSTSNLKLLLKHSALAVRSKTEQASQMPVKK